MKVSICSIFCIQFTKLGEERHPDKANMRGCPLEDCRRKETIAFLAEENVTTDISQNKPHSVGFFNLKKKKKVYSVLLK